MEYYDEKIMREKNERRKYDIYEGEVSIGGEKYQFMEHKLYEDTISIMLPDSFIDMPDQFAKVKYPMEHRPSCIKTNQDTSVNFAFNFFSQKVDNSQLADMMQQFRDGLKRMYPTTRFYDARVVERKNQFKIGWFDMKTSGYDEPIYTIMAFTPVDEKLLHIIFNAPVRNMTKWKSVALQAILSVCVKGNGGKDNNERV